MRVTMHTRVLVLAVSVLAMAACTPTQPKIDVEELKSEPQQYVGSETCKSCHLEHYDAWQMTIHSRMLQDAQENQDAIVVPLDPETIRADLQKIADNLKVPPSDFYIPTPDEVVYTIGSQWKQRYIVEKDSVLYISPIQYNIDSGRWVNYHEADWDQRPWIVKCGGCHATGVTLNEDGKTGTISEPAVGCEACHGKGSWHAALPKEALFEKRETIVNPAKLTQGVATQICGSCHNRGKATQFKGAGWPVGYEPGKSLEAYYESTSFAAGDASHMYGNEFSSKHHQQYIDWRQSKHMIEGVTCTSCHYVHRLGVPPTRLQTREAGSQQCLTCHEMQNRNHAHSIHTFSNCIGCHMPRIVKSAESGDLHSHVFQALIPAVTLNDESLPNSCQTCHKHAEADLEILQQQLDILSQLPHPQGKVVELPKMPEQDFELLRRAPARLPADRQLRQPSQEQ